MKGIIKIIWVTSDSIWKEPYQKYLHRELSTYSMLNFALWLKSGFKCQNWHKKEVLDINFHGGKNFSSFAMNHCVPTFLFFTDSEISLVSRLWKLWKEMMMVSHMLPLTHYVLWCRWEIIYHRNLIKPSNCKLLLIHCKPPSTYIPPSYRCIYL